MNIMKLYLRNDGSFEEVEKNFSFYKGSFLNNAINVYVPLTMVGLKPDTNYAVKIGGLLTDERGKQYTTKSYFLEAKGQEEFEGVVYNVYGCATPSEFLKYVGTQKIVANVVEIVNNKVGSIVTSQVADVPVLESERTCDKPVIEKVNADVIESARLCEDEVIEPSELEKIVARINDLELYKSDKVDSVLKFDVKEVPVGIEYSKNGLKTIGVLFLNETFEVKNENNEVESVVGSIIATNIEEKRIDGVLYKYQNETLYFKNTSAHRVIRFQYTEGGYVNLPYEFKYNTKVNINNVPQNTINFKSNPQEQLDNLEDFKNKIYDSNTDTLKATDILKDNKTVATQEYVDKAVAGFERVPGLVFDTLQDFKDWLAGTYTRPDEKTVNDLILGEQILLKEQNVPDYWYSDDTSKPITIANFSEYESKVDLSEYLKKTDIVDNLNSVETEKPLSANMGKKLNDEKVAFTDVIDNLDSTDIDKPLSANQGKILKEEVNKKLSTATEQEIVYGTDKFARQTTIHYNKDALGGGIAQREEDGRLKVGKPTENGDATNKKYVDDIKVNIDTDIDNLVQDKFDVKRYAIADGKITQEAVRDILTNYTTYEGAVVEFVTNAEEPSKTFSYGYVMKDKNDVEFLVSVNNTGTMTQWTKNGYKLHYVKYIMNVGAVDCDSLTVDYEGEPARIIAGLEKAFNKPENTSDYGTMVVILYNSNRQLQIYTDVTNNKVFTRTINGTADRHEFGVWQEYASVNYVNENVKDNLKFTEQTLTEEQKAQARTNIGAGASGFSGSFNDLTDVPIASEVLQGIIEIASDSEATAGTDTTKAINSKQLKNAIDSVNSVRILNKGVVEATESTLQDVATQYVVTNYGRQPKQLDGLIITRTDLNNDKIEYAYSEVSSLWYDIGRNNIDLTNYLQKSDVVNSLVSSETKKPLSAYQGNVLYGLISKKANPSDIPTNNNQLTNGAGYIKNEANAFNYNNLSNKPSLFSGDYNDLSNKPDYDGLSSKVSTNTQNISTNASDIQDLKTNKVSKVSGKGLSSNDFTDTYLNKLNGIEDGAQKNVTPKAVLDFANDTDITFRYSGGGKVNPDYYACWNGYQVTYVSKSDVISSLGINGKANTSADNINVKEFKIKLRPNAELLLDANPYQNTDYSLAKSYKNYSYISLNIIYPSYANVNVLFSKDVIVNNSGLASLYNESHYLICSFTNDMTIRIRDCNFSSTDTRIKVYGIE